VKLIKKTKNFWEIRKPAAIAKILVINIGKKKYQ